MLWVILIILGTVSVTTSNIYAVPALLVLMGVLGYRFWKDGTSLTGKILTISCLVGVGLVIKLL